MANRSLSNRLHPRGFSYAEILLSVVLLTALLVPALQALQSGVAGGQSPSLAARQLTLRDKMEQLLAKPFADLYAHTSPGATRLRRTRHFPIPSARPTAAWWCYTVIRPPPPPEPGTAAIPGWCS